MHVPVTKCRDYPLYMHVPVIVPWTVISWFDYSLEDEAGYSFNHLQNVMPPRVMSNVSGFVVS
jgi:hypothetical protein